MLPKETVDALLPPDVGAGRFAFQPMTLLHAAVLDAVGIDFAKPLNQLRVATAGFVLSSTPEDLRRLNAADDLSRAVGDAAAKWAAGLAAAELPSLAEAVYRTVAKAYSTLVPPAKEDGDGNPPDGQSDTAGR